MKIKTKIIVTFILVFSLGILAIAYVSFSRAKSIAVNSRLKSISEMVNLIDININSTNKLIGQTLKASSDSYTIRHLISQLEGNQSGDIKDIELLSESKDYLHQVFQELGNSSKLQLVSEELVLEVSKAQTNSDQVSGSELEYTSMNLSGLHQTFYREVLTRTAVNDETVFFGRYPEDPNDENLHSRYIVAACNVGSNESTSRAILALIPAERYYSILPISMGLLQDQTIFILDRNNTLISSDKTPLPRLLDEVSKINHPEEIVSTLDFEDTEYHVTYRYNGLTGWKIYSVMNSDRIFPQADTLKNFITSVAVVILLVTILLFAFLTNQLTKPLKSLVQAMQEAQAGNYDIKLNTKRRDEIGELNSAFNYMTSETDRLVHQVYENELRMKNSELKELQAQINPHFIYNILESINWILIDKGDYETSEIIRSLAGMLRYSTQNHNDQVPLKEEVNFVDSYLRIQKYRLEDKLEYSISIPEYLSEYPVPKLILQPLVENAVVHGVIPSGKKCKICITAFMDEELSIIISDDGVGINQDWIDNINSTQNIEDPTAHTGMINVHRRLALKFGEEYGITADRSKEGGTKITVSLPLPK